MKIVKNYLYNVGYNVLILLTPLLTVPYISRVLGPSGVGINATTNSVITYFLLAGTVGITIYGNREIAFIRDDHRKRSQTFWEIEFLQITTILLAYLAFCIFLYLQKQLKIYFFYQSFGDSMLHPIMIFAKQFKSITLIELECHIFSPGTCMMIYQPIM
ncbi:hypothetical protein WP50_27695 [Lactiplantibacillus plantarum]|nr:hypothetical protein WP50_27695 [Lactiplantibacillus plantarum]